MRSHELCPLVCDRKATVKLERLSQCCDDVNDSSCCIASGGWLFSDSAKAGTALKAVAADACTPARRGSSVCKAEQTTHFCADMSRLSVKSRATGRELLNFGSRSLEWRVYLEIYYMATTGEEVEIVRRQCWGGDEVLYWFGPQFRGVTNDLTAAAVLPTPLSRVAHEEARAGGYWARLQCTAPKGIFGGGQLT